MPKISDSLLLLAFPFFFALLALSFAVPRLASSFLLLPSQETVRAIGKGKAVSDGAITRAVDAHLDAAAWHAAPEPLFRLGGLRLVQAKNAGYATSEGRRLLEESLAFERQSLSLSPVQPYGWVQLLQGRLALEGPSAALSPLFTMAVRAGPTEPRLVMHRLAVGLSFWTFLDAQALGLLKEQALIAARYFPTRLAVMTKKRYALKIIRDALAGEPALRSRFDRIYSAL